MGGYGSAGHYKGLKLINRTQSSHGSHDEIQIYTKINDELSVTVLSEEDMKNLRAN